MAEKSNLVDGLPDVGSRVRDEDRTTRKPLAPFDRLKLVLLWLALWGLQIWAALVDNPLQNLNDAAYYVTSAGAGRFLILLTFIEALRQFHFVFAEWNAKYYAFWQRFFARNEKFAQRFSPWTRFRVSRIFKWVVTVYALAAVVGSFVDMSPFETIIRSPQLAVQALPFALQIVFYMFLAIIQFVAIFYFLSRGGIEVYMPDDVKTRFSDVWGQDAVLERVKENILFLENPDAIESRGGHVPGGILLWGPPGTGKTLMAEAVAGETGRPYVFVDPGAFVNMFFGIGVLKVKGLFRKLRKLALRYGGVIVFFDEADTLGSRGGQVSQSRAFTPMSESYTLANHSCNGRAYASEMGNAILADEDRKVIMGGMGGGRSFDGTLQALLTELSGLKKPRGFLNRIVRRTLGMRPKQPPKYRILVMMATNMPDSLDPALLRPGRIDRIYRVGYPSKEGRIETYQNYLNKVTHNLTAEQVESLATISPYATGATIKDTVNEALVIAIREGRDTVEYADVIKAKSLKQHGLPDGGAYVDRERHSVALHEACHAVTMYRLQHNSVIDVATIERRGDVGGFVSPIPLEDRFVQWKSEVDTDVVTFIASLAGEQLFYDGDHTQGVGGDMAAATSLVTRGMLSHAMGPTLRAFNASTVANSGLLLGGVPLVQGLSMEGEIAEAIEERLQELYDKAVVVLKKNRAEVLAVTHALETHRTISGEDVAAVIEGRPGPLVDGTVYATRAMKKALEEYHSAAVAAHKVRDGRPPALPELPA